MVRVKRSFAKLFFFCMLMGILICSGICSQIPIPLGSKLSVEENNTWVSPNGDFAIGFLKSGNEFSFGIRFNSDIIPLSKQSLVWVAGGDIQVSGNSYFELTKNGELVLFDSTTGMFAWMSKTSNASVESAILRDDGNLILINKDKTIVWQSFDTPSDTLLPGQNLSVSETLRPPKRNSVSSYYSLFMDVSGQLHLRWETSVVYWNSSETGERAMLNSNGIFQLFDRSGNPIWSAYSEDHDDPETKFRFLRLDGDGNLRIYSWINATNSWRSTWQAVNNQCNVFATCYNRGVCYFNASGVDNCRCTFSSDSKCLAPYKQDCRSGSSMITHEHTLIYGIYPPNETIIHRTNLQQCRSLCRNDPLCTAASFKNDGSAECSITRTQYISGGFDASLKIVSFIKSCSDPIAVLPPKTASSEDSEPPKTSSKNEEMCITCLLGVSGGIFVFFILIQVGIGVFICKRRHYVLKQAVPTSTIPYTYGCMMLSYGEIRNLTEDFKYQIGPKMFKGVLPSTHQTVVVKNLNVGVDEKVFRRTVMKMGSIHHKNLVKLEGYCCDNGQRLLVYEFVKNGSVKKCLEDSRICKKLTWKKRLDICVTVAKAVAYLHSGCREFVSHGNLKWENVVLDDNLDVKVSEFGLKLVSGDVTDVEETAEIDVKDFGKMLLEVISRRLNDEDVCEWAYEKWVSGESERILDEGIECGVNSEELERAMKIAFWSVQVDDRMRPSMGEVVKVLEGMLSVDTPPDPFIYHHQPFTLTGESLGSYSEV